MASTSSLARPASKLNETEPSSGSTVTVGVIRNPRKTLSRSLARKSAEAISSWIALASFSARRSLVGVVIRSTWATRTFSLTSPCATRQISDDLP